MTNWNMTLYVARAKGEVSPAPAPINQLPGELHKIAQQLMKLHAVLEVK